MLLEYWSHFLAFCCLDEDIFLCCVGDMKLPAKNNTSSSEITASGNELLVSGNELLVSGNEAVADEFRPVTSQLFPANIISVGEETSVKPSSVASSGTSLRKQRHVWTKYEIMLFTL